MLFESPVVGVAVAMTVASIFQFEFWFLSDVVLGAFLGALWRPLWILRGPSEAFGRHFGGPWGDFLTSLASFWLLWGAMGIL